MSMKIQTYDPQFVINLDTMGMVGRTYSTTNEHLPYFSLVSVSPPCVSPGHGGFIETAAVNSR